MNENEFEKDVNIDTTDIANEWNRHPMVCDKYTRMYSQAIENLQLAQGEYELAKSKHEIERAKAFLSDDIRKWPGKYGVEKVTDKTVESATINHQDYQKEVEKYNERRKETNEKLAEAMRIESRLKAASAAVVWHRNKSFDNYSDEVLRSYFFK